jgi:excisionase family DNA binding protein
MSGNGGNAMNVPTASDAPRTLLTTRQVAGLLGVSRWRVRRLAAEGQLDPVRFSPAGHLRFRQADVERLVGGGEERAP